MSDLAYIECKGVRVPADWTIRQLRIALAKRFIRFAENDEHDIVRVFGDAIKMKAGLQDQIRRLQVEIIKLVKDGEKKRLLTKCPGCGYRWTVEEDVPVVILAKASPAKRIPKRKYKRRKAKTEEKHG